MPALSPTMTEGNISAWRVKEGDKFAAGDVLLEIETDKATMDVEAQEDGILMKIMQGDGAKQVQVGSRIAVIAEEGDDISSLEIPPEENATKGRDEAAKPAETSSPNPETQPESPVPATAEKSTKAKSKAAKQTRPLLPSVSHLLKENGIDESAVADMTPTGPHNRLLKGDVLAYLGKVKPEVPAAISERFNHQSNLDLSNIKVKVSVAEPKDTKIPEKTEKSQEKPEPEDAVVALPVSLEAVIGVQQRVSQTLGTFLPLSTFIARATELANDELPLPAGYAPSADELFNQVLGLDKVHTSSRGRYMPQVSALPPASLLAPRPAPRQADIIDILAAPARKAAAAAPKSRSQLAPGTSSGVNVFSLTVPKPEEKRARVFLERVKLVLENDPGRLVL